MDDEFLSSFAEQDELFSQLDKFVVHVDDDETDSPTVIMPSLPEDAFRTNDPLSRLTRILDNYQEQPYLLDPHLERMIEPVVHSLRRWLEHLHHLQPHSTPLSAQIDLPMRAAQEARISKQAQRYSRFLYFLTKVRGYKTIVRFFPHEVQDLSLVLSTFGIAACEVLPGSQPSVNFIDTQSWEFRYVMLLWLSLICMIPFDLSKFDQAHGRGDLRSKRSEEIEQIGWSYLGSSGKEREAAALVLARLMIRQDVATARLVPFLEKCLGQLEQTDRCDVFKATGIVQVLCIYAKLARHAQLLEVFPMIYQALAIIDRLPHASNNINLRKLRCKLSGRIAIVSLSTASGQTSSEESEPSEAAEVIIQEMLERLHDKDTIVRWSAAKYVGRIGQCLPGELSEQVCDAILELFTSKVLNQQDGKLNLIGVSEHTWHGACLACAEYLRRKLFPLSRVDALISYTVRALHFEQRKGVHNIGSGVRDAAAYVLWSLSRAFCATALEPHGNHLAIQLVLQSLFDREVHIRRAGSAAFQENVGRLGIFPHGIDVLQCADFFTVGLRRSAFLRAAPSVARFKEYRQPIIEHLFGVCVPHWDIDVRELAAQALAEIFRHEPSSISSLIQRLALAVECKDPNKVHGTLLTLAELARLLREEFSCQDTVALLHQVFEAIRRVPEVHLLSYNSDPLLIATCQGFVYALSPDPASCQSLVESSCWTQLVKEMMKRTSDKLHHSVQCVLSVVSKTGAGEQQLLFLSKTIRTGLGVPKQASARCLGGFILRVDPLRAYFSPTFDLLVEYADMRISASNSTIEVKRNALESLVQVVVNLGDDFEASE